MDPSQSSQFDEQPHHGLTPLGNLSSIQEGCLLANEDAIERSSDVELCGECSSDDDDEMLRYAIMLSLQIDEGEGPTQVHATQNCMENATSTSSTLTTHHRNISVPHPFPNQSSISMSPSRLTSLPQELKEIICSYVFSGETIVVKPGRDLKPRFLITWGHHLSLLLVSRELNSLATRYLISSEVILDLRQFRTTRLATKGNDALPFTLDTLLSNAFSLRSVCSKLLIRQGQCFECDNIEQLLPALTHVELYDYKSCREIVRESGFYSGRIFEYELPMMTRPRATSQLKDFQESLPPSVCADLIYVCDTLVCIPKYDPENPCIEHAKPNVVDTVMSHIKNALKKNDKIVHGEGGKQVEKAKEGPRYKTAKLRHLILFNRLNPGGVWLSKEWVVAGLGVQSLSLGDIIAIHCHEYCLELIERGETVGV